MDTVLILLQGAVVLGGIFLGVKAGGVGLGLWGGVGTAVLVFAFGLEPADPPVDAVFIILAVILAASAMQAAGGIDWLVSVAAKIIRRRPAAVTYVAPLVALGFCAGAGTGNIVYPLMPVVYDVAYENDVRPERPMSVMVVASALAVVASPVSAATAAMLTLVEDEGVSLAMLLAITVPAVTVGVLLAATIMLRRGLNPSEDPEIQAKIAAGELLPPGHEVAVHTKPDVPQGTRVGMASALIFVGGVFSIVTLGLFEELRPTVENADGEPVPLPMSTTIQLVMFVTAAIIVVIGRVGAKDITAQEVWGAGLTSAIALFGVAWMASTFIAANEDSIVSFLSPIAEAAPLLLAVALFLTAALTTSQSTATRTMIPIGLAAGLTPAAAVGMWPAVGGVLFFPANGPQIASIEFDQSGTTRIPDFILAHSFQIPMAVAVSTAVIVGYGISIVAA